MYVTYRTGETIRTLLAVILTALGWKVYQALSPAPAQNAQETPALAVGDAESGIEAVCGKPVGISEKSGLTTYYFDSKEIDVRNGVIAAIRDSVAADNRRKQVSSRR